jgi:hypothetical protein
VAVEALRARRVTVRRRVTRLARRERLVRAVAADAWTLWLCGVSDLLAMTAVAPPRLAHVMLIVAARAGMPRGGDDRRTFVAARAGRCLEVVRLVAARARVMAYDERAPLFDVAARARRDRFLLVHRVAIDAAVETCVLGLPPAMAIRASSPLGGRLAVWLVTATAVFVGVNADCSDVPLFLLVTAHAVPRRDREVRAVAVTIRAARRAGKGRRIFMVQRRGLGVAVLADVRGRFVERVAVTGGARELADVLLVTDRHAHLAPLGGDVLSGMWTIRETACSEAHRVRGGEHREHDAGERRPSNHRAPIGWHIRHGIASSAIRLDQPGGWGLPPMPPTRWQSTHSCSPAPPWQLAHDAGSRRASRPCWLSSTPTQPGGCGLARSLPATPTARWHAAHRSG